MKSAGETVSSALPNDITIEILSDFDSVRKLKDEWLQLEARVQDQFTYFQTYDWCEHWCEIYACDTCDHDRRKLFIVAIKKDNKLASVWPLVIERRSRIVKVLRFLGEPLIQYGNILLDHELLSAANLKLCWQEIKRQANCDAIVLDRFTPQSPLYRLCNENKRYQSSDVATSLIDVRQFNDAESFIQSQTRSMRKSRKRKRKKLEAFGDVKFEVVDGKSPLFTDLVKTAMQMKVDWLNSSGRSTASMLDIRTLQLLTALQTGSNNTSGPVAMSYSLNGKPIALEIGFCHKLHYYSFIGAFDWQMREFSPGKLQLEEAVKWTIENEFETYDFLGNPSEYKDSWTNKTISIFGYSTGKTFLGIIYANYWKPQIRPAIKTIFTWMPISIRQKIVGISQNITSRR